MRALNKNVDLNFYVHVCACGVRAIIFTFLVGIFVVTFLKFCILSGQRRPNDHQKLRHPVMLKRLPEEEGKRKLLHQVEEVRKKGRWCTPNFPLLFSFFFLLLRFSFLPFFKGTPGFIPLSS